MHRHCPSRRHWQQQKSGQALLRQMVSRWWWQWEGSHDHSGLACTQVTEPMAQNSIQQNAPGLVLLKSYGLHVPREYRTRVPSYRVCVPREKQEPWGREAPWEVRVRVYSLSLGVTHSEPLSLFLLPGVIIPTCHSLAPSQLIPALKKNLVQWNPTPNSKLL